MIFPAYQNIQKPEQKKTTRIALLKTASVRVSFVQIMQEWSQNNSKSVWKSRYVWDVSIPPSLAIAWPQAIQFNKLDATNKTWTNSFASLDVYKHVLQKSLACFDTMLQGQCTKQPFFHVISHKQTKVNNMLLIVELVNSPCWLPQVEGWCR